MPATVTIDYFGNLSTKSYTIGYIVDGVESEKEAIDEIISNAPAYVTTTTTIGTAAALYLQDVVVTIDANVQIYKGTATYGTAAPNDGFLTSGDDTILSLQISSQQVMQYLFPYSDVVDKSDGFLRPGYIAEGLPVIEPLVNFVVRKKYDSLPSGWGTSLADKVGVVNSVALFGADVRCMMYLGCSTDEFPASGGGIETQITHTYAYKKAEPSFVYKQFAGGVDVTIPARQGWDILNIQNGQMRMSAGGPSLSTAVAWQIIKLPSADITP